MKRILMLHTGGTLGMSGRRPQPLKPDTYTHSLLTRVPELRDLAQVDVEILFNVDSSNMTPPRWLAVARRVVEAQNTHDGFVVIHGTDTMAYTASALAFLLEGRHGPVVFTGSQKPLGETRSDARGNLVGAVEMACQDIPEVGIYFDSRLFRGVRTLKTSVWQFDAFESPNLEPLARAGVDLIIHDHVRRPQGPLRLHGGFTEGVVTLQLHPGLDARVLDALVGSGQTRGIILRAFGAGNLPVEDGMWPAAIRRAVQARVPVVVVSQVPHGGVDLGWYECGQRTRDAGAADGGDLTTPAAVVKLMWGLHQGLDVEGIRALYQQDLRGEGRSGTIRPTPT